MIALPGVDRLEQALRGLHSSGEMTGSVASWLRSALPAAASLAPPAGHAGDRRYSRSLLYTCDAFEILAIHWEPGCVTPIHDHGGALCWFAVAKGNMGVENYLRYDSGQTPGHARIGLEGREDLEPGGIDYRADDVHLHRCIAGGAAATTLHLYARPLGRFNTFDDRTSAVREVLSSYDARLT